MRRSTKGCDSGAYGTVFTSSTSRTQVRLPLVELEQPVMIRTHVRRRSVATDCSVEHAAPPHAIHRTAMHATAHDLTRALVHDHQHPMRAKDRGFASKQIYAPQAVLRAHWV